MAMLWIRKDLFRFRIVRILDPVPKPYKSETIKKAVISFESVEENTVLRVF